jgi:aminobenzoyl-glutamate utilization protein B
VRTPALLVLVALVAPAASVTGQPASTLKKNALALVETQRGALVAMSDRIWELAETALREEQSAKVLADYAEAKGFKVERGVAGLSTAFVASYGEGRPVIAIIGEYDALPGISQKASTVKDPFRDGAAGHGCGHNLFGAASLGAAVAIKEMIEAGTLKGTIRFLATPAEESIGGKIFMIRDGVFKDVDAVLVWHPADETRADNQGVTANVQFFVEFKGRTAHAAGDPWNGRSAADAIEAFTHGLNLLREHVKPTVRIHYTVQRAGDVPNVVPDYGRILTWVRDSRRKGVDEVFARVQEIARGAALIAGVESTATVQTGYTDMNILESGLKVLQDNLTLVAEPSYTPEEQSFARALQKATGKEEVGMNPKLEPLTPIASDPRGASSDVGDVSWVAPTLHVYVATAPKGVPWHAWPVVASSRMSIGHKGMMRASQVLAATAVDLFTDATRLEGIKAEWRQKMKGVTYRWLIPDGPPIVK